jgi:hypothetical protein
MSRRISRAAARPSVFLAVAMSPNKIGGLEIFSAELARQLDKEGWNLTLCFEDAPPPLVEAFLLAPGNVSLTVMREQLGMGLSNAREFLQLLRRYRPRVLLYSLGGVVRWWPLMGWLTGVRRRVYFDGTSRTAKTYGYRASRPIRILMRSIALIAIILLGTAAWFAIANRNSGSPLRISQYTQFTHNGHAGSVYGTDGSRLYLTHTLTFSIEQVAVSGGEIETVPSIKLPKPFLSDVSPDGSTLLVQSLKTDVLSMPLYTVQVVGGAHRYLADAIIASGTWSPDGKHVAYSIPNGDINVINSDGTGAHKLASVGGAAYPLNWSPDGSKIRFSKDDLGSLWEITSSGSNLHQVLAGWHPSDGKCCGRWSPDGKFLSFSPRFKDPIPHPKSTLSMSGAGYFVCQPKTGFC